MKARVTITMAEKPITKRRIRGLIETDRNIDFSIAGRAATKPGGVIAAYSHRSAEIQGVSGKDRLEACR
jgi:hypothetical protein